MTRMFNPFRKTSSGARPDSPPEGAEQALIAEALLGATTCLIGRPNPKAAAQHLCECIARATPYISLAWVWFGDLRADVIEPQVVVGPAAEGASKLQIERRFFAASAGEARGQIAVRTRCYEVSPTSLHSPWRNAATSHDARSILLVPIADGGPERGWLAFYATRPRYFESLSFGLFETLGRLLHAVVTQSQQAAEHPSHELTDTVTGLATRHFVRHRLAEEWRSPSEHDTRGLLVLADLDGFRAVNDRYGRTAGNLALRNVGQALRTAVRKSDLVARWGEDEFLLWLPGISGNVAAPTGEKLRQIICRLPVSSTEADSEQFHASIGAATVSAGDTLNTAFDRAERALRRAKENGRNCVAVARAEGR